MIGAVAVGRTSPGQSARCGACPVEPTAGHPARSRRTPHGRTRRASDDPTDDARPRASHNPLDPAGRAASGPPLLDPGPDAGVSRLSTGEGGTHSGIE